MRDVIVIGGGPGGLCTARQLARNGFDVALMEEHHAIGSPVHCTGVLSWDAYTEFDLPRTAILNHLNTVRFYSPSGQTFSYTHDRPEAVVIDRAVFDEALGLEVEAAGVAMIHGRRVRSINTGSKAVTVRLESGETFDARACVLACGANYTLHRSLGLGRPALFLGSAQAELSAGREGNGDVELHFSSQIAPKGFAWAVPVRRGDRNYVRVGLMCESHAPDRFRNFASSIADRWGISRTSEINPLRKILPLGPIARTYAERLLVVGDAAGLVKPTTGGGIYYSIVSAAIAAEVLTESLNSNELGSEALEEYQRRWRRQLGAELEMQLLFRTRAHDLLDSDIEDLFALVRSDGILPLVRNTAKFNHHRKLIMALFRHRQFQQIFLRQITS